MGQHAVAVLQTFTAKAAQSFAGFHVFGLHSGRFVKKNGHQGLAVAAAVVHGLPPAFAHAVNGPAQVYGRGAGVSQPVKQFLELGGPVGPAGFVEGQGAAPGRSNTDGRSPAHHHGLQCVNNIVGGAANYVRLLLWQNALIKQMQREVLSVKANVVFHSFLRIKSICLPMIHKYAPKAKHGWRP